MTKTTMTKTRDKDDENDDAYDDDDAHASSLIA